jgi:hypothetical protein
MVTDRTKDLRKKRQPLCANAKQMRHEPTPAEIKFGIKSGTGVWRDGSFADKFPSGLTSPISFASSAI